MRQERNFLRDQSGMRAQLLALDQLVQLMDPQLYLHLQSADSTNFFFFFRMLLVWYKREFEWSDVLRLWETLWTDYFSSSFHLFIALAILEKHRDVIMDHLKHFDEVLKYSKSSGHRPQNPFNDSLYQSSQRAIQHNGPNPNPHPRRVPLPSLRAFCPGNRQERQLPRSISTPAPSSEQYLRFCTSRWQGQITAGPYHWLQQRCSTPLCPSVCNREGQAESYITRAA